MRLLYYFLSFLLLLILSCSPDGPGRFSFYALRESELSDLEKKWFTPKVFRHKLFPIVFYEGETLWYSYELYDPLHQETYIISLSKRNLGWRKTHIQNKYLKRGKSFLIDKFRKLEQGHYRMEIFLDSESIDQIEFSILPDSEEVVLDYDRVEALRDEDITDDIIFYSEQ